MQRAEEAGKHAMKHNRAEGFSTIEVLVSMAVLATSLIPLLQMGMDAQRLAVRAEHQQLRADALTNAIAYYRTINVGVRPEGDSEFGHWALRWQSQLVEEDMVFTQEFQDSRRIIGFYETQLTISYATSSGTETEDLMVRSVGWKVETPSSERLR